MGSSVYSDEAKIDQLRAENEQLKRKLDQICTARNRYKLKYPDVVDMLNRRDIALVIAPETFEAFREIWGAIQSEDNG